tara:strand:- start:294 stop:1010 length:717 start_codon:yes stop_codon:yes gene_type:complete
MVKKTININSFDLSLIFWKKILENSFSRIKPYQSNFFEKINSLDNLRSYSSYNTGSISSTSAWLLFSITLYFKPKIIVEVGSFIGKSTFSMAFAADDYISESDCRIYCCDYSNEIKFPDLTKTEIIQYHKTSSTQMIKQFEKSMIIDLIHLDGRLENEDNILLKDKVDENTFFILDDFEGNEKGVVNFSSLIKNNVISRKTHCLIYPLPNEISEKYNLLERSTSAVILPVNFLKITNQ